MSREGHVETQGVDTRRKYEDMGQPCRGRTVLVLTSITFTGEGAREFRLGNKLILS